MACGESFEGVGALAIGGAGFVGSNLVSRLLETGCRRIVVVDNFLSSERWNLPEDARVEVREGSIGSSRVLEALEDEFAYVFHLATFHGNQNSIVEPLADHDNNLVPTLRLYERLRHFRRIRSVVYAASGCTLAPHTAGEPTATEEDGPVPFELDSPYQISKLVGELYSVYYHRRHAMPTVRARFQNVYGPREILGAGAWRGTAATVWRNVTPTFIYRALKGWALALDDGGVATRDFIYVEDIVRGLLLCATRGTPGQAYNLASGTETSIRALAVLVRELTGSASPLESLGRRGWDHSVRRFGSPRKAWESLGFRAEVPLRVGLERTIAWTRAHLDRIDACVGKHAALVPLS